MTVKEFRDQYYPLPDKPEFQIKYRPEDKDHWNIQFINEFHRIRCRSQQTYNTERRKGTPTWQTIARLNKAKSWRHLLEILNINTYQPERPTLTISIQPPEIN